MATRLQMTSDRADLAEHNLMLCIQQRDEARAEVAELRRQLAECQAERSTIKRICDATQDSLLAAQAEADSLRNKWESAERTIQMTEAARRTAIEEAAALRRQLAEGQAERHAGPHEHHCLACNGTGEIDSEPEYTRCPLCHGSGRGRL